MAGAPLAALAGVRWRTTWSGRPAGRLTSSHWLFVNGLVEAPKGLPARVVYVVFLLIAPRRHRLAGPGGGADFGEARTTGTPLSGCLRPAETPPVVGDAVYPLSGRTVTATQTKGGGLTHASVQLMVISRPELRRPTVQPSLEKFLTVVSKDGGPSTTSTSGAVAAWPMRSREVRGHLRRRQLHRRAGHGQGAGPPARPQRVGHAHQAPPSGRLSPSARQHSINTRTAPRRPCGILTHGRRDHHHHHRQPDR